MHFVPGYHVGDGCVRSISLRVTSREVCLVFLCVVTELGLEVIDGACSLGSVEYGVRQGSVGGYGTGRRGRHGRYKVWRNRGVGGGVVELVGVYRACGVTAGARGWVRVGVSRTGEAEGNGCDSEMTFHGVSFEFQIVRREVSALRQ